MLVSVNRWMDSPCAGQRGWIAGVRLDLLVGCGGLAFNLFQMLLAHALRIFCTEGWQAQALTM
jgi:hypothetical protein